MGNPRIRYTPEGASLTTITFPEPLEKLDGGRSPVFSRMRTRGGVEVHQFHSVRDEYIAIRTRMDGGQTAVQDFVDAIQGAFWSHLSQGGEFELSVDLDDAIYTTLDGAAASGQKVIPLTDTTGIQVNGRYFVEEASAGGRWEVITVASISAGVSVTAVNNLVYSYVSGDGFRSRQHFPKVVSLDEKNPITETEARRVDFRLPFTSAVDIV